MTRIEQIIKAALEGRQVDFAPLSREEVLLIQLSQKMAAGGADPETIRNAVDEYLRNNPIGLDDTLTDPNKAAPASAVGAIKDDYAQQIELLKAVRDALKGGDIDGAVGLLDTYLLDKEVLA